MSAQDRNEMTALVLSGGGNYGPLQVGALQILMERGLRPDLLVGNSAGALNAAFLATDPTPRGVKRLADLWRSIASDGVGVANPLAMAFRFITGRRGLLSNEPLRRFIEDHLPPGVRTFGDLPLPVYTIAVRLDTGQLHVFGDSPSDRLLDGLMASTAVPALYPPWICNNVPYVDGSVVSDLPLNVAAERGGRCMYALSIAGGGIIGGAPHKIVDTAVRSLAYLTDQQVRYELRAVARRTEVALHHIRLVPDRELPFLDFGQAEALLTAGRRAAMAYLAQPEAGDRLMTEYESRINSFIPSH